MTMHEHTSVPARMTFKVVRDGSKNEASIIEQCACGATRTVGFKSNPMWGTAPATREEWQAPTLD